MCRDERIGIPIPPTWNMASQADRRSQAPSLQTNIFGHAANHGLRAMEIIGFAPDRHRSGFPRVGRFATTAGYAPITPEAELARRHHLVQDKKFGPLKFICDDFVSWQDNIRAIALTLTRLPRPTFMA